MNAESVFGVLYILVLCGGFAFLLGLSYGIFNLIYKLVPAFRVWYDKLDEGLPNWDDVEEG